MKKQIFSLLLAGFLLLTVTVKGQKNNYPTKEVNGIEYYIYTVQPKEGLYSISRKFDVSTEIISKINPEVKNGLKIGQQILIPSNKEKTTSSNKKSVDNQEFIQHKVEKKQTLFAISKKYGVSQEDIKKYNPEIINGLREGTILQIPKLNTGNTKKIKTENSDKNTKTELPVKQGNTVTHTVQQGETLYSISKLYNIEVVDLINANPGSASKISVGSELIIPAKKAQAAVTEQPLISPDKQYANENKKVIKLAYLLPFMLDQSRNEAGNDRFVDFYAGSLLAIEEAKERGISLEIYAFDTEKSEEKMAEILNNPELKNMDLIIGPAFSNLVYLMEDFVRKNKVNTLIPFTAKVPDIEYNPNLFQFNPGSDTELRYFTELLNGEFKNVHLIFADVPDITTFDDGNVWSQILQREFTKNGKPFDRVMLNASDSTAFERVLRKNQKNMVIFNTDKYSSVSPYISGLSSYSNKFNIVLFEQYSWVNQAEKSISGIYLSPFVSYLNPALTEAFNAKFFNSFKREVSTQSPRYDLLGYDLTSYFISLINKYGDKFNDKVGPEFHTKWIQSQLQFERISNGSGFINQRLYLGEDN